MNDILPNALVSFGLGGQQTRTVIPASTARDFQPTTKALSPLNAIGQEGVTHTAPRI